MNLLHKVVLYLIATCLQLTSLSLVYAASKPNILLIISDDAGYHDFGFHGSKTMKTPNLDKFAKHSILFKQAYVTAAVCGPSRAGLFTGKYQQKFGFEENNVPGFMSESGLMGDEMGLPLSELTIADHLRQLGYTTGLIGKWHLGDHDKYHPIRRGFDHFYGFRTGSRSYYAYDESELKQRNNERMERGFKVYKEHQGYLTDALVAETSQFITTTVQNKQPFFAVLSLTAVHAPMQAKPEDLAQFPNLTGTRKILAAMNLNMDQQLGLLFNQLERLKIANNTLVVFVNDNGGPTDQNHANNYPLSGTKANHLEGGIRVPMLMRLPDKLTANMQFEYPVSTLDLMPTFLTLAGANLAEFAHLDGVNLLPYLNKKSNTTQTRPHKTLYWKKENRAAIRDMDWKLLRFPDRPVELYNLAQDQAEQINLAKQQPQIVKDLYQKLFAWELTLERPLWQLKRQYEGAAMRRMDKYRNHKAD
ncbi:sulfatase-like hydrolase/transferase [Algibacillus agarilyticus]|uniref:sulfatase-like hydrolase/transferase n=1 Tax=Algibacillus agarilyticus TaxID=2234133 RepID=UPI000DD0E7BD|nr:sulfatase-like hydrolase/transferase [Algibacillus agarilyticus]